MGVWLKQNSLNFFYLFPEQGMSQTGWNYSQSKKIVQMGSDKASEDTATSVKVWIGNPI